MALQFYDSLCAKSNDTDTETLLATSEFKYLGVT